jgi:CubicO group peptidase (beta-lactamase class C family)
LIAQSARKLHPRSTAARRLTVALCFIFVATSLCAEDLRDRMDGYIRRYADAELFSGVVQVSKGDRIIYENAFGLADRALGVRNTLRTKFQIASLSKPITATAILLLVQDGKLSFDDKLAKFIPEFPNGAKITIEELLTHYSGLGDASAQPDYNEWSRFPQTTKALVDRAQRIGRESEPGTAYFYSNSNYHILAFIIEKVSGQSYGEFLTQRIFKPAGMTSTAHRSNDETIVADLANGYAPAGASGFERATYLDWTSKTGNGSIYSTAGDLLRFHRALQNGSLLESVLLKQSYGFERKDRQVGMFWFHRERFGHRSVYVNGSSPGFKAHLERFIDDDATVTVLSNVYIAAPSIMADDLGAMLFGQGVNRDIPKAIRAEPERLRRFAGTFRFGDDYFVKNAVARIEPQADHLDLVYPATSFSIPLLPIEGDRFFDRKFWSFIRFEDDKLIYRNNDKDYVAVRQ